VLRALLLYKQGWRQVRQLVHPRGIELVKLGGRAVDHGIVSAGWGLFTICVALFMRFMLVLVATGLD
jgi:trk system potassium uptake protein TrkH